jgi:hypothetical protein
MGLKLNRSLCRRPLEPCAKTRELRAYSRVDHLTSFEMPGSVINTLRYLRGVLMGIKTCSSSATLPYLARYLKVG